MYEKPLAEEQEEQGEDLPSPATANFPVTCMLFIVGLDLFY